MTTRTETLGGLLPEEQEEVKGESSLAIQIKWSHLVVFVASLAVYLIVSVVVTYILETANFDGLARIAQAHAVVYSREPKLAAIGFVWPPLPVLVDLALIWILKPLGLVLLTGPLMSSLFGALAMQQMWSLLERFEVPTFWRVLWVAGFGLHPLILHNAVGGLSEAPFIALLLMSINGFLMWERNRRPGSLLISAIAAAAAVYCRYEGLAWIAVMVAAIVWVWLLQPRRTAEELEGTLLAYVTPGVYAMVLWVFMNWLIMGSPLHFLTGPGSTATTPDTAKTVGFTHPFFDAQESLSGTFELLFREMGYRAPMLLVGTVVLLIVIIVGRRWRDLTYMALAWSIVAFTFLIAYRGLLPAFVRYFIWAVPAGVILGGAAVYGMKHRLLKHVAAGIGAVLLLMPIPVLIIDALPRVQADGPEWVIEAWFISAEDQDFWQAREELVEYEAIGRYLSAQEPGTVTLVDGSIAAPIAFFMDRPEELLITSDSEFFPFLRSPVGQFDQLLVPFPTFDAAGRSEVLRFYPELWELGRPWAVFTTEFDGVSKWRLFRVLTVDEFFEATQTDE